MTIDRPSAREISLAEEQIIEESKRIEFYLTEYSVEMLALKVHEGEFVVPEYQRNFTWEPARKSRFIESLVMGLPIPFLFFWEMPDGRLEIVDGSQRLRTIEQFLYRDLQLGELKTLNKMSGFRFSDLPPSRQRKIKNRSVRGIVLNEHADQEARLDMFQRINTGSKIANPAEIRRGALAGSFMNFIIESAKSRELHELAPLPKKQQDERGYEELVTRFFAYSDGLERSDSQGGTGQEGLSRYQDNPSEFLYDYVEVMNKEFDSEPGLEIEYRERGLRMLRFVKRNFPNGFKKTRTSSSTPRSRFEAIAVGVDRALRDAPSIDLLDSEQLAVANWIDSEEFKKITSSDGANARSRLEGRIDFVRNKLVNGH